MQKASGATSLRRKSAEGEHGRLSFPHPERPETAAAIEVAPGILWASLPLPFRLNHVNVWLIEDGDGWAVVDTGVDNAQTRALWLQLLSGPLHDKPITQLIATHGHVDHVGLAGWLWSRYRMPFRVTAVERLEPIVRRLTPSAAARRQFMRFHRAHGASSDAASAMAAERVHAVGLIGPQPPAFVVIEDGDVLRIGGRDWRVIVAGGHARQHASFVDLAGGIMLVGDQVLPTISPVIGVFADEPEAEPLGAYLDSLRLFECLPADMLVLPSHGLPFRGLHARLADLRQHHDQRLAALAAMLGEPRAAFEIAAELFARAYGEGHRLLAFAETLAHLHRLVATGQAARGAGPRGGVRFHSADSSPGN